MFTIYPNWILSEYTKWPRYIMTDIIFRDRQIIFTSMEYPDVHINFKLIKCYIIYKQKKYKCKKYNIYQKFNYEAKLVGIFDISHKFKDFEFLQVYT